MMKAYPEYRDSGLEWLGEIPSRWEKVALKHMATEEESLFIDGDWIESKDLSERGMRYITTGNVGLGKYKEQGSGYITEEKFSELNCTEVFANDLLISRLNSPIGRACLVPDLNSRVVTSVDNVIMRPNSRFSKRYLVYLFSSNEYINNNENLARGATMQRISRGLLGNIRVIVPETFEEQEKIADYLDIEVGRIDNLISEKENFIKLLSEKRQALISHVVTKGLNTNVPMKESGVEWIGEIPEHWKVGALGYYGSVTSGSTPDRSNESFWNGDIPWIKTGEIKYNIITSTEEKVTEKALSGSSIRLSPKGTILMAMYGQGNTRGRVAILGIDSTYNQACAAITLNSQLFNSFLFNYYIAAYEHLRMEGNLTSQTNLNAEIIKKFKVVVPPIKEQREIVSFLESNLKKYDNLKEETLQSIELLKEHRMALISAAVTGKIDVREES